MSGHVIPASRLYGTVHIRNPAVAFHHQLEPSRPGQARQLTCHSHDGQTVCGLLMLVVDLWIDWQPEPGDHVCADCRAGQAAEPDPGLFL